MNFNLISDPNNGYDYQTRFREDIVIKKNSKIYLNYAEFSKLGGVSLVEDQKITLETTKVLPNLISNNPNGDPDQDANDTTEITIPKGSYTFYNFSKTIVDNINTELAKKKLYYYYTINEKDLKFVDSNDFSLGLRLNNETNYKDVSIGDTDLDVDYNLNFIVDDTSNNEIVADGITGEDITTYQSYGISPTHYFHYQYNDSINDDINKNNLIKIRINKPLIDSSNNDLKGRVGFGLYSKEYGEINKNIPGWNIIHDNNLPSINNYYQKRGKIYSIPKAYFWIDIVPDVDFTGQGTEMRNDEIVICIPAYDNVDGNKIKLNELDINSYEITKKGEIKRIKIQSNLNISPYDQKLEFFIQTYYNTFTENFKRKERKLYFKVYLSTGSDILSENLKLYDSRSNNVYFPAEFFEYEDPTDLDESSIEIPFNVIMGATHNGDGFEYITYREFDKNDDDANEQRGIIEEYNFKFSDELQQLFSADITPTLFPNTTSFNFEPSFFYLENLFLDYLNENYSIIIDELPMLSYKNTENQSNGGYSQAILANVPAPFSKIAKNTSIDKTLITSIYEPQFKIINDMRNQEFKTNHLRVKIIKMRDNTPATDLIKSVINFTIYNEENDS